MKVCSMPTKAREYWLGGIVSPKRFLSIPSKLSVLFTLYCPHALILAMASKRLMQVGKDMHHGQSASSKFLQAYQITRMKFSV